MFYLTVVCVLVAVVACAGVAVLSISLADWKHSTSLQLSELRQRIERTSGAELRAELDALAAAATKHAASVRKQFGTLWAEIESMRPPEPDDFVDAILVDQPQLPGIGAPPVCSCGWCQACKARANGAMVQP